MTEFIQKLDKGNKNDEGMEDTSVPSGAEVGPSVLSAQDQKGLVADRENDGDLASNLVGGEDRLNRKMAEMEERLGAMLAKLVDAGVEQVKSEVTSVTNKMTCIEANLERLSQLQAKMEKENIFERKDVGVSINKLVSGQLFLFDKRVNDEISMKNQLLSEKEEMFQKLYAEYKKNKEQLEGTLYMPVIRMLIEIYHHIQSMVSYYQEHKPWLSIALALAPEYDALLKEFENCAVRISTTLSHYGVELINPKSGEDFDYEQFEAVERVDASEPSQDNKVEHCVAVGYRYKRNVIQCAKVAVLIYNR